MPGKLKAKIVAGRHLPVMDRASDLTDAFVEVSGGAWSTRLVDIEICDSMDCIYLKVQCVRCR